ncbi:MAG: FAD-dependent monooxygenase [Beijerinckiaceae bacterium]
MTMQTNPAHTADTPDQEVTDIVIAGGGLVGLTCALALHQELGGDARIIICDPAPPHVAPTVRAYAVAAAGRHFLQHLGLWSQIEADAQTVNAMVITDSHLHDPVRQPYLNFNRDEADVPLAHLLDEGQLVTLAREAVKTAGIITRQDAIDAFSADGAGVSITLKSGQTLRAALLVAADGAKSRCRELAGIGTVGWDYDQTGLVALVGHDHDHEGKAWQHFLPPGPFAILPMTGRRSSIVWNESKADAELILDMDEEDQLRELEQRFGAHLGTLTFITKLRGYPLRFQISRRFAGERLVLIGDAAHVVHPIAGQGLNLGLKDAEALARRVGEAARLGLDLADPAHLAAYETDRRFETVSMGFSMDTLNRLFSNDWLPLRLARDLGLGIVDRLPAMKRFFMREAAGERPAPRDLQG